MNVQPFNCAAKTLPISVSNSASTSAALPAQGACLRFINAMATTVFVAVGTGTQTATTPNSTPTTTSTPILAGTDVVLSIDATSLLNISVLGTTSGTVYVQVGEGQ